MTVTEADFIEPGVNGQRAVDIELLVQWALAQTGYLPWRAVTERELAFDHGYTVIPHGVSHEYRGQGGVLRAALGNDANAVIDAIKALPPRIAASVIACGRSQTRPPCFAGIEPRKVWTKRPQRKKGTKRRHRKCVSMLTWEIHPDTIAAARTAYQAWHGALSALAVKLPPQLDSHAITGFSAPPRPWLQTVA